MIMTYFSEHIAEPIIYNMDHCNVRDAFCISTKRYTYGYLKKLVASIRYDIKNIESRKVALVVNDDIETYASILALWFEGKCYVPLHPNQPIERCMDIIGQVDIKEVIDSSAATRYAGLNVYKPYYSEEKEIPFKEVCEYPDTDLAYILFTSGSTGKPKGVMITRGNVGSFMDSFKKTGIRLSENDRCMQCFDLTFDVSVQSFLSGLTVGACVYTVQPGNIKYIAVASLIEEEKITFGAMAPSMLRYLRPYFEELDFSSMKVAILTAEASPLSLVEEWLKYAHNVEVYDFYGPTEATIYCTYYKLSRSAEENKALNGMLSIGKPLANVEALVVDEDFRPVKVGEKGELCVAGKQITAGYWDNPEKNSTSFVEIPVRGENHRFYRTGDLCYMDEDGDIMYAGRMDNQAKIQGFRVELGEIEFHAVSFLNGRNVIAMAFDNESGLTEIALFIESEQFDVSPLETYLRSKMPAYMIPSRYLYVPIFPLNASDKIDRVKLKTLI